MYLIKNIFYSISINTHNKIDFIKTLSEFQMNSEVDKNTMNRHKKFIDSFNLDGKARFKTHELLKSYFKTEHKLSKLIDIRNFK